MHAKFAARTLKGDSRPPKAQRMRDAKHGRERQRSASGEARSAYVM